MSIRNLSVLIAVVHNNDPVRNAQILPHLGQLRERLADLCQVGYEEVSSQPDIVPLSVDEVLARRELAEMVARDWEGYRGAPPSPQTERPPVGDGERRACAIEAVVSDKHIRVWEAFLRQGGDVLICFEDDAVFRDDSIDRVISVLSRVAKDYAGKPLYADLAGGFPLHYLGLELVFDRREGEFVHFSKPVTNTACAYLLTRELVTSLLAIVTKVPACRTLAIDWLLNKLLVDNERNGVVVACFHMFPTIFEHGSASGRWAPWQR